MRAGAMDRVVTLHHVTLGAASASGEQVPTWGAAYATVWGQRLDPTGREYVAAKQVQATMEMAVRIYHRTDILATDRVTVDGTVHELVAPPLEIKRGEGLTLLLRAVS